MLNLIIYALFSLVSRVIWIMTFVTFKFKYEYEVRWFVEKSDLHFEWDPRLSAVLLLFLAAQMSVAQFDLARHGTAH